MIPSAGQSFLADLLRSGLGELPGPVRASVEARLEVDTSSPFGALRSGQPPWGLDTAPRGGFAPSRLAGRSLLLESCFGSTWLPEQERESQGSTFIRAGDARLLSLCQPVLPGHFGFLHWQFAVAMDLRGSLCRAVEVASPLRFRRGVPRQMMAPSLRTHLSVRSPSSSGGGSRHRTRPQFSAEVAEAYWRREGSIQL